MMERGSVNPANIYLFEVNNGNTRMKTSEGRSISIHHENFRKPLHIVLVFSLLTLKMLGG